MKANELRIGNLVCYSEDNTIFKIYAIERDGFSVENQIEATWIECGEFKPIQLTEEWLLKFGFVKSKVSSQFDKEKLTIQIANELEYHKKGRVYFNSWAILEESIKYVHQLQNLYFALTGEELTFKS